MLPWTLRLRAPSRTLRIQRPSRTCSRSAARCLRYDQGWQNLTVPAKGLLCGRLRLLTCHGRQLCTMLAFTLVVCIFAGHAPGTAPQADAREAATSLPRRRLTVRRMTLLCVCIAACQRSDRDVGLRGGRGRGVRQSREHLAAGGGTPLRGDLLHAAHQRGIHHAEVRQWRPHW